MQASTNKILRSLRSIKNYLLPTKRVQVGRYRIETTPNHPLASYLEKFPLYDKLIPSVCKSLKGTIIDIGANIGDTMAAILDSNPELNVVCVEPDDNFYRILERNRMAIDSLKRVKTLKAFITDDSSSYKIIKNPTHSTGHLEKVERGSETARSLSFGQLLDVAGIASPTFVKSDTDGFDASILASIAEYIQYHPECRPILFFEMQTYLQEEGFADPGRGERLRSYLQVIERLQLLGYRSIAALDNFGTPVTRSCDITGLNCMHNYIACSQNHNNYASIYFLDVVLYQDQHLDIVNEAFDQLTSAC